MKLIRLHPNDCVAVAIEPMANGCALKLVPGETLSAIERGHKVALRDIRRGEWIRKYQQPIGQATADISVGSHVHSHNMTMATPHIKDETNQTEIAKSNVDNQQIFQGYLRTGIQHNNQGGTHKVGTRNFVGVMATVSCAGAVCKRVAAELQKRIDRDYPGLDGAIALTHGGGCAVDGHGEGLNLLQRTLAGWIKHPNFAGILLISLGCETNQIDQLLSTNDLSEGERLHTLTIQNAGGSAGSIALGVETLTPLLEKWSAIQRQPLSVSHLRVALQCGGSDGFSGISANPALGLAMDKLVALGGTAILSETPEIYGAEHLLKRRAKSPKIAQQLQDKVDWWQHYVSNQGGSLDHNPSPGNKAGGLTTILEKSLGAVAKAGSSTLNAVYDYAEPIDCNGFVFMDSPGYDPVSITGQVASGANVICFTTGRGSAYGCKPVPCLKLASNSALWQRMTGDMDINCGALLDGEVDLDTLADQILQKIIDVASGQNTVSELLDLGEDSFLPWLVGPIL